MSQGKRIHAELLKHEMKGQHWKQKGRLTCLPTDVSTLQDAQTQKPYTWGGVQTYISDICFLIHLEDCQKLIECKQKLTKAPIYVWVLLFSAKVNHNKSLLFPSKLTARLRQIFSLTISLFFHLQNDLNILTGLGCNLVPWASINGDFMKWSCCCATEETSRCLLIAAPSKRRGTQSK